MPIATSTQETYSILNMSKMRQIPSSPASRAGLSGAVIEQMSTRIAEANYNTYTE
ncbi:MAG: hypothetical protein ACTH3S_18045 [Marinobacter sp.]|uniref:hypothetical protein n=1 Tax=Marinobacter sp. TaxID=50741 RepID=UPI003F98701B